MIPYFQSGSLLLLAMMLCAVTAAEAAKPAAQTAKIGVQAPLIALKSIAGGDVNLHALLKTGPVVLVVLRGWPGYQCPLCDIQTNDFIAANKDFTAASATVLMVYPGPAEALLAHAQEFAAMKGKQWPQAMTLALDPDYAMVNAYGLRWDAPSETAYPSTFVIDRRGIITFAKVSKGHGDRTSAAEVLAEVRKLPAK